MWQINGIHTYIYLYIYTYIYKYYERKKGRNYIFPTSLFRESLHSIYIYIYIYKSLWPHRDQALRNNINRKLTMAGQADQTKRQHL